MASTSDIRNGFCFDYNNDIFVVIEFQHVKPGKGAAFVRTKMKSVTNGKVIENNFPSGHKLDEVRVERRKLQYLYEDETGFNFMDNESFEQFPVDGNLMDNSKFLLEGMVVEVLFHAEKDLPLVVELPPNITTEITYTEPGLKGDTATNAMKQATILDGVEIKVPLFINTGDFIKVDTRTGAYMERVKQ